jgi:Rad3-related DNA helicase
VVAVPYATLLSDEARAAVGLSLHNALVLIDEAHNIPEALRQIHGCRITLNVLQRAHKQLTMYLQKYASRLAGRNLYYIGQLCKCVVAFVHFLQQEAARGGGGGGGETNTKANNNNNSNNTKANNNNSNSSSQTMSSTELLFQLKLDNVNFWKLDRYLQVSRLPQKLLGFQNAVMVQEQQQQQQERRDDNGHDKGGNGDVVNDDNNAQTSTGTPEFVSKHVSALSIIQTFLKSFLTRDSSNTGIYVAEWPISAGAAAEDEHGSDNVNGNVLKHATLRYAMLQPSAKFQNVVDQSYAVVLAGGTLRPFVHMASELLSQSTNITSNHHHCRDNLNINSTQKHHPSDDSLSNNNNSNNNSNSIVQEALEADKTMQMQLSINKSLSESNHKAQHHDDNNHHHHTKKKNHNHHPSKNFNTVSSHSLVAFSCGHVIPPSNVYLSCLSTGPTQQSLDFRHKSKLLDATCDELGRILFNFSNICPAGLVVFLSSYTYEAHLVQRWRHTGLWHKIGRRKVIHRETRDAQGLDAALAAYSKDAGRCRARTPSSTNLNASGGPTASTSTTTSTINGAMLLCVIGGKMSEGINFANDMARTVVVVGMPYGDMSDPELQQKMASLDASASVTSSAATSSSQNNNRNSKPTTQAQAHSQSSQSIVGIIRGRDYYQNLCFRAINQSIGRAIRHANDYAAVVLVDVRYSHTRNWKGLPQWMRDSDSCHSRGGETPNVQTFGKTVAGLCQFFKQQQRTKQTGV